jgi:hypothetical protein
MQDLLFAAGKGAGMRMCSRLDGRRTNNASGPHWCCGHYSCCCGWVGVLGVVAIDRHYFIEVIGMKKIFILIAIFCISVSFVYAKDMDYYIENSSPAQISFFHPYA